MGTVARKRLNLAYEHATIFEVRKLNRTVELYNLIEEKVLKKLEKTFRNRPLRILRFFAALNRAFKYGFVGTKCTLLQLADHMSQVLREAMSLSTLRRGLDELQSHGYITRSEYNVELKDKATFEIRNGQQMKKTLVFITLTQKALKLWNGKNKSKSTIEKLRNSSDSTVESKCRSKASLNNFSFEKINNKLDKSTVCENLTHVSVEIATAIIETRSIDKSNLLETMASNEASDVHQKTLEHQTLTTLTNAETLPIRKNKQEFRQGVTVKLPPKVDAKKPKTYWWNRLRVLLALDAHLSKYPARTATALYKRAKEETAKNYDVQSGISANWKYYIKNWHTFTEQQQKQFFKNEIIPGLLSLRIPNPDNPTFQKLIGFEEPKQKTVITPQKPVITAPKPLSIATSLPPWLKETQKFVENKFGKACDV